MEATTKEALIELIGRNYPDAEMQVVEACIGRAFNMIFYETFRNDMSNLDLYAKTYADVSVLQDEKDTYYSLLPVQTVQFPDVAEGVRRIYLKKGARVRRFIPVSRDSWNANSLANRVSSLVCFSVKSDRVEYKDYPQCDSVYMDLVVPFELMDEDDPVYIPSGKDIVLFQMVDSFLKGTPKVDKVNA